VEKQNNAGAIASNAGDDFHLIWAGKKLLDILKPNSKLTAISVEGPTWADSIEIEDEQKLTRTLLQDLSWGELQSD
jgi:hypothetical protein